MAEDFVLSGDPGSISASGRTWGEFSTSASTASTAIKGVQAGTVQGDEWTQFTDDINDKLPGHLDTTSEAWGIVSSALITYADKLTGFQQRMSSLKTTYDSQQATAANAKANLDAAHRSDTAEKTRVSTATATLKPGETLPPSTYVSSTSGAQSSFTEANGNLQATVNAAAQVRKDHSDALQAAVGDVTRAKGMRFQKPPGWFGSMMHSIGGWIKDHADLLAKISSVLKVISAIAGVLSFIPVLAPIMGPIALVTGGAALAIDVTLKLVTGKGSWTGIIIDAATMALPGAGKLLGKGLKTAVGAEKFAGATGRLKSAIGGTKAITALRNSPTLAKLTSGVSKSNAAFEKFALKVPGVRAANIRAGRIPGNVSPRFSSSSNTATVPPKDLIHERLTTHAGTAKTEYEDGTIGLSDRQQVHVDEKPHQENKFKGQVLDKRVKELAEQDPYLTSRGVTATPQGKKGPDWVNPHPEPHEKGWYDLTTQKEWNNHQAKYDGSHPKFSTRTSRSWVKKGYTPGRTDFGHGALVSWQ